MLPIRTEEKINQYPSNDIVPSTNTIQHISLNILMIFGNTDIINDIKSRSFISLIKHLNMDHNKLKKKNPV